MIIFPLSIILPQDFFLPDDVNHNHDQHSMWCLKYIQYTYLKKKPKIAFCIIYVYLKCRGIFFSYSGKIVQLVFQLLILGALYKYLISSSRG